MHRVSRRRDSISSIQVYSRNSRPSRSGSSPESRDNRVSYTHRLVDVKFVDENGCQSSFGPVFHSLIFGNFTKTPCIRGYMYMHTKLDKLALRRCEKRLGFYPALRTLASFHRREFCWSKVRGFLFFCYFSLAPVDSSFASFALWLSLSSLQ